LNTSENAEKRRNVIELRKEGKTIREIAKQMHKSSRTVMDILKDNNSKEEREESRKKEQEQQNAVQSNYTKALRLFKEGKSLLDVTIELGVFAEETKKAFFDFWEMSSVDDFRGVYEDIKPYLPDLMSLWKTIIEKGLGVKSVLFAIQHASDPDMLGPQIIASKIQLYQSLVNKSPPPEAAENAIVAPGVQPNPTNRMQDKLCSGDFNTTIKD
jgi:transposase